MILTLQQIEQLLIERKKPGGSVPLAWDRAEQDMLADTLSAYAKVVEAAKEADRLSNGDLWGYPYGEQLKAVRAALAELEEAE